MNYQKFHVRKNLCTNETLLAYNRQIENHRNKDHRLTEKFVRLHFSRLSFVRHTVSKCVELGVIRYIILSQPNDCGSFLIICFFFFIQLIDWKEFFSFLFVFNHWTLFFCVASCLNSKELVAFYLSIDFYRFPFLVTNFCAIEYISHL